MLDSCIEAPVENLEEHFENLEEHLENLEEEEHHTDGDGRLAHCLLLRTNVTVMFFLRASH